MKKVTIVFAILLVLGILPAQAAETPMYVNEIYVVRELAKVGDFDMLPILDIAGELGYICSYDGTTIHLTRGGQTFTFTMGSPNVYDQNGLWFGLDVVPQIINGKVMIPANFLIYNMGACYTWDSVTNTLFLNSENTYHWLINTPEYPKDHINIMENAHFSINDPYGCLTLSDDKSSLHFWGFGPYSYNRYDTHMSVLQQVHQQLGLPDSLMSRIRQTRAIDGTQTQEYGNIFVTWTYHPDNGLDIIYELK